MFVGGASTVTGSCFYMEVNDLKLLVDCGMRQGNDASGQGMKPFPFNPVEIDHVLLTHAHLDHSGLLPRLVKEGFRGAIITTSATKDLLVPMLYDSASIQESDAEWLTKKALRTGLPPVEPLYTSDDVTGVIPLFDAIEFATVSRLGRGVRYRFMDAGHILGSASIEIWFQDSPVEKKIVFSGDIGNKENPIIKDPSAPESADFVVMETTYGDRNHKPIKESIDELVLAIKTTFKRGGNVFIPSFAVGRAQDLLYIINNLVREGRLYRIDVYLDSPLAEEVTKIYLAHPECFDEEARRLFTVTNSGQTARLHFTRTVEESMSLNRVRSGCIIIAGSGMCDGGRIRHHLKHNLWRGDCSVIFTGFQARGTLGRRIVDGEKSVNILGEEVAVRAAVYTINGFSAHADKDGLFDWLSSFSDSPQVFMVHGEEAASDSFSSLVKDRLGLLCYRPVDGETFEI